MTPSAVPSPDPPIDCGACPRLVAYRARARADHPDWFNGAVPSFGVADPRLVIVGLAPGLQGANRTGRPFTGDYAGDLLFATLIGLGLARGAYQGRADDGLTLVDCLITNAARCVPPENKPTPAEIATCRPHLAARLGAGARLRAVLALGTIAHDSALRALGARPQAHRFAHGALHRLPATATRGPVTLIDSYHCSRYNTNTGRLTPAMFEEAVRLARAAAFEDATDAGAAQE